MAWEKSGWFRTLVVLAALVIVGGLIGCAEAQQVEFFILWGMEGRWNGGLEVENGRFLKVEPYSFETRLVALRHGRATGWNPCHGLDRRENGFSF
jgi:hypothetical protein